jgi:hypothetical protein
MINIAWPAPCGIRSLGHDTSILFAKMTKGEQLFTQVLDVFAPFLEVSARGPLRLHEKEP